MKKLYIMSLMLLIITGLYSQIGTHIPSTRLPFDSLGVLEWTKAGCLKQIEANNSLPKHIIQCASEEGEIPKK